MNRKIRKQVDNIATVIFGVLIIVAIAFGIRSCRKHHVDMCQERKEISKWFDDVLGGEHRLMKITQKDEMESSGNGSFFLFYGSYHEETYEATKVRFCYENYIGEYQFYEINLDYVTVITKDSLLTPYVVFDYQKTHHKPHVYTELNKYIESVKIFCSKEQFRPDIDINQLK